jgi:hypothetical protein
MLAIIRKPLSWVVLALGVVLLFVTKLSLIARPSSMVSIAMDDLQYNFIPDGTSFLQFRYNKENGQAQSD